MPEHALILQDLILIIGLLLPVVLNINVLWRLLRNSKTDTSIPWRKSVAYFGTGVSWVAYSIPLFVFFYNATLGSSGRPVYGDEFLDWSLFLNISLGLAGLSFVSGLLAPKNVRIQLIASAVVMSFFWLSIPMGVL